MKRLVLSSFAFAAGMISLGCSMGGDVVEMSTSPDANAVAETCCCEYREEGATAPSYSDMARSNCENWGYACVDEGRCEAAADAEEPAAAPAEEAAEVEQPAADDAPAEEAEPEEVVEAAPAPAPVARPTGSTMTRGRTTMSRDGGTTTTKSGTSTRGSSSGSSSGSRTMKR